MYRPLTQTLNLRLAVSRDGRRWWYPDRRPCLDNAPLGDYGGGMIWQSQYLIEEDSRIHLYYGGTEGPHRQIFDTRAPSQQVGYLEKRHRSRSPFPALQFPPSAVPPGNWGECTH